MNHIEGQHRTHPHEQHSREYLLIPNGNSPSTMDGGSPPALAFERVADAIAKTLSRTPLSLAALRLVPVACFPARLRHDEGRPTSPQVRAIWLTESNRVCPLESTTQDPTVMDEDKYDIYRDAKTTSHCGPSNTVTGSYDTGTPRFRMSRNIFSTAAR